MCEIILRSNAAFGARPTCLSTTLPSLINNTHGMLVIPYFTDNSGFSSTFTLPIFTLPSNSTLNASIVGVSATHGAHLVGEKSILANLVKLITFVSKLLSVNVCAMFFLFFFVYSCYLKMFDKDTFLFYYQ